MEQGKSARTVTVACKLPHGLSTQMYVLGKTEDGQSVMQPVGERVVFKGANSANVVGGYGFTEVDADYWFAWVKQNAAFAPIKAGLIFAQEKREKASDQAMDQAKVKTGFEGVDPSKPGRGIEPVPEKELLAAAAMGA